MKLRLKRMMAVFCSLLAFIALMPQSLVHAETPQKLHHITSSGKLNAAASPENKLKKIKKGGELYLVGEDGKKRLAVRGIFNITTPSGKKLKAIKKGGALYLVGEDGKKRPAARGKYYLNDGQILVVSVGGKIAGNPNDNTSPPPKNRAQFGNTATNAEGKTSPPPRNGALQVPPVMK